jgi:hypothetical protein
VVSITFGVVLFLAISILTQRQRITALIGSLQSSSNVQNLGQVLAEETSRMKLAGLVILQTPLIAREDVNIDKNLNVQGEGIFVGNITAPNIIYDIREGEYVIITDRESQTPTISVDLSDTVRSFQGQSGNIVLEPGTDITIDGLKINNVSTLQTVASRGHCASCITDADVADSLTVSSDGQVAAEAIKSGTLAPQSAVQETPHTNKVICYMLLRQLNLNAYLSVHQANS